MTIKIPNSRLLAVGAQSAEGTVDAVVKAATVIGEAGGAEALGLLVREDSLDRAFERIEDEIPDVPGSFTKQAGLYQRTDVTLSFDLGVKGGGTPTPSVDTDFDFNPSQAELLKGLGIVRSSGDGTRTDYIPGAESFLTFKMWRGTDVAAADAEFVVLMDCKVTSWEVTLTPGEVAVATFTISVGSLESRGIGTFPTAIDFGTQSTLAPPILRSAQATLGVNVIGYRTGTLTVEREESEEGDSNAPSGIISEKVGFNVGWSGEMFADEADPSQHLDILESENPPTEDFKFFLGDTLGAAGGIAQAVEFVLRNVHITARADIDDAGNVTYQVDANATTGAGAINDEFILSGV